MDWRAYSFDDLTDFSFDELAVVAEQIDEAIKVRERIAMGALLHGA